MRTMTLIIAMGMLIAAGAWWSGAIAEGQKFEGGSQKAEGSEQEAESFHAVSIYLDTADRPLAAYQIQLKTKNRNIKIVGLEGNPDTPFQNPPYYDRVVDRQPTDHLILAAFSTNQADQLPRGRVRIATIHLMTEGDTRPTFDLQLIVAADDKGLKIDAKVTYEKASTP